MLVLDGLTKRFGAITAVDHISFTVARGEVLGFLGPNGAGKSTTMKMVTGFLEPTSGTARVCGFDIRDQPLEAKRRMGYLPEGAPAYPEMTPMAFLEFCATVRGLSGRPLRKAIGEAIARTQLQEVMYRPIEALSKGFKRRVGLAQALLHDPEVLVLDEPTDGLDPNQKFEVRSLIKEMAADKAIVISTHILEEVDAVCTRAMIIARGKVLADATPAELEARDPAHRGVLVTVAAERAGAAAASLQAAGDVEVVLSDRGPAFACLRVVPRGEADIYPAVQAAIRRDGIPVDSVTRERGRLDDVFRAITTGSAKPQPREA